MNTAISTISKTLQNDDNKLQRDIADPESFLRDIAFTEIPLTKATWSLEMLMIASRLRMISICSLWMIIPPFEGRGTDRQSVLSVKSYLRLLNKRSRQSKALNSSLMTVSLTMESRSRISSRSFSNHWRLSMPPLLTLKQQDDDCKITGEQKTWNPEPDEVRLIIGNTSELLPTSILTINISFFENVSQV